MPFFLEGSASEPIKPTSSSFISILTKLMSWSPKYTLKEAEDILCSKGMPHELETGVVNGRSYRVYKNLWPSLRDFWLWVSHEYRDRIYVVFDQQQDISGRNFKRKTLSYSEASGRVLKAASVFRDLYGVQKGDRVGICSRNFPDYLVAFWACHMIGAVSVLVNAWLPLEQLRRCLVHTQCKVIVVDSERADRLEESTDGISAEAGTTGFLVLEAQEGKGYWKGMKTWDEVMTTYRVDSQDILMQNPDILPEDNACIIFTSGTTGFSRGGLSTQRMYLTGLLNIMAAGRRAAIRQGYPISTSLSTPRHPQKTFLDPVPLFHITGMQMATFAAVSGMKILFIRKWMPEDAARIIKRENVAIVGGVPSMVADLVDSSAAGHAFDALMFGGAPAPILLAGRGKQAFPAALMSQGYGMTELAGGGFGVAGEDLLARPASTGLPAPAVDALITKDNVPVATGQIGELWIRGPNTLNEYWGDPEATAKVTTKDGWLKTGDIGRFDEEGFLYILDRQKDVIIRGGENIDSVSVENALYADPRLLEVAAVAVPDERLGELVAAVVSIKPGFHGLVTEEELIAIARQTLPAFAVPIMIVMQNGPFERTPSGKILKADLRKLASAQYAKRQLRPKL